MFMTRVRGSFVFCFINNCCALIMDYNLSGCVGCSVDWMDWNIYWSCCV